MVKGKADYEAIPALPAQYAGVTFRSRLEARWAFYFDLIGVEWKYEPEGYALKAGNYCPDFQCWDWFVEVKPTEFDKKAHAAKLAELSRVTGAAVFCVVDDPNINPQQEWVNGQENMKGSFSHYAFNQKGWKYPYITTDPYRDSLCEAYAHRARSLRFNRGGIAEVDWELYQARNAVIRHRQEAFRKLAEMADVDRPDHIRAVIEPLNKRLVTLNRMAGE